MKHLITRSFDISLQQSHPLGEAITILQNALAEIEKQNGVAASLCVAIHYDEFEYSIEYKSPETEREQKQRLKQADELEQRKQQRDRQEYERLKKIFE